MTLNEAIDFLYLPGYKEQFEQNAAVFTSIESRLQDLSQSRYFIINPRLSLAVGNCGTIEIKGIVPAESKVSGIEIDDEELSETVTLRRVMFYYGDDIISEYMEVPEFGFVGDVKTIETMFSKYHKGNGSLLIPAKKSFSGLFLHNDIHNYN